MNRKMSRKAGSLLLMLGVLLATTSCGVKGPPLPPVAANPVDSEREPTVTVSPSPNAEVNTGPDEDVRIPAPSRVRKTPPVRSGN
ncbi:MAG: hypothetical protein H7301_01995 [Cryobacterium sp.]|nr:hypothetical protein [Oligoflexia bacterium]